MNIFNTTRILLILLISGPVFSQSPSNPWKITVGANAVDVEPISRALSLTGEAFNDDLNITPELSYLGVSRYIKNGISIDLAGSLNRLEIDSADELLYYSIDGGVSLSPRKLINLGKFDPTIKGGIGYSSVDEKEFISNYFGLGLSYWFNESLALSVQSLRKLYSEDLDKMFGNNVAGIDVYQHVVGVSFAFGDGDTDGDGVKDSLDACPDVPGLASLNGCPDDDGDGVINSQDDCPFVPGLAALNGCPDGDQDGITDADDACPDEAGLASLNGCPDSDGDGLANKNDDCPSQAGPKANGGCPWPDTDGDGVYDKDDECVNTVGVAANKGCPLYPLAGLAGLSIKFDSEKSNLDADDEENLAKAFQIIFSNKMANISIEGHADATGEESFNNPLSTSRAEAVKEYLVNAGIDASRLSTKGFGESDPIASNRTKAGRAENRRVVFKVVE